MSGRISDSDDDEFDWHFDPIISCFEQMGIDKQLLRGIYALGYEKPFSDIQARAIVPCIKGKLPLLIYFIEIFVN